MKRLVQYYKDGLRAGYLIEDTEFERAAKVQIETIPARGTAPKIRWVPREDIVEVATK